LLNMHGIVSSPTIAKIHRQYVSLFRNDREHFFRNGNANSCPICSATACNRLRVKPISFDLTGGTIRSFCTVMSGFKPPQNRSKLLYLGACESDARELIRRCTLGACQVLCCVRIHARGKRAGALILSALQAGRL
jgi:hypothetical protein